LADYSDAIMMVMNTYSLHRNKVESGFYTTGYINNIFHINYTTYNLHCAYDMLNPRTHANFIMLSHKDEEEPKNKFPYWFRWIVGIFHTAAIYTGPSSHSVEPQHMEFLFVWWSGYNLGHLGGWKAK
jgi:hypothetical protein